MNKKIIVGLIFGTLFAALFVSALTEVPDDVRVKGYLLVDHYMDVEGLITSERLNTNFFSAGISQTSKLTADELNGTNVYINNTLYVENNTHLAGNLDVDQTLRTANFVSEGDIVGHNRLDNYGPVRIFGDLDVWDVFAYKMNTSTLTAEDVDVRWTLNANRGIFDSYIRAGAVNANAVYVGDSIYLDYGRVSANQMNTSSMDVTYELTLDKERGGTTVLEPNKVTTEEIWADYLNITEVRADEVYTTKIVGSVFDAYTVDVFSDIEADRNYLRTCGWEGPYGLGEEAICSEHRLQTGMKVLSQTQYEIRCCEI